LGFEQSRVSHNLACLLHCGFVLWNRNGKKKLYRLNPGISLILAGIGKHLAHYAPALESCGVLEKETVPVLRRKRELARRDGSRAPRRLKRSLA
jgi:hypothetical protein